eukprot:353681-Chlamydomonas_euryale.AAC.8
MAWPSCVAAQRALACTAWPSCVAAQRALACTAWPVAPHSTCSVIGAAGLPLVRITPPTPHTSAPG